MKKERTGYIHIVEQLLDRTKHTIETLSEILSIPMPVLQGQCRISKEEEDRFLLLKKLLNK